MSIKNTKNANNNSQPPEDDREYEEEKLFNYFLEGWKEAEDTGVSTISFSTSENQYHVSFMLKRPFSIREGIPFSQNLDDSFIASLLAKRMSSLLLPMSNITVENILDQFGTLIIGFKLIFLSEAQITSIKTCKSKVDSAKKLELEDKLILFYEFLTFSCDMLCNLGLCWSNVEEIPIAELNNGKWKFIPFNAVRHVQVTSTDSSPANYNWHEKSEKQLALEKKTFENYCKYFKELYRELCYDKEWRVLNKRLNEREEKIRSEVNNMPMHFPYKNTAKDNLFLMKAKVESILSKYVWVHVVEDKVVKKVFSSRAEKIETKKAIISTILDCLLRYDYLFILDISGMSSKEVKELQCQARRKKMGEYHFISLELFIKYIVPEIRQIKERKGSKRLLTDLVQGQIGLFFSNEDIYEVNQFISSFSYEVPLDLKQQFIPRDLVVDKGDIVWKGDEQEYTAFFKKRGLKHRFLESKFRWELLEDLKLPKGTKIDDTIRKILAGAGKINSFYLRPYQNKFKVLTVLEKGIQLPLHLVKLRTAGEDSLVNSLRLGFDYLRAIEMETIGKATDFSEEAKVRSKFIENLKAIYALSVDMEEQPRNEFEGIGSLIDDYSSKEPEKMPDQPEKGEEIISLGEY